MSAIIKKTSGRKDPKESALDEIIAACEDHIGGKKPKAVIIEAEMSDSSSLEGKGATKEELREALDEMDMDELEALWEQIGQS